MEKKLFRADHQEDEALGYVSAFNPSHLLVGY